MNRKQTRREFGATTLAAIAASVLPAPYVWRGEEIRSGASDSEIKLGQTVPHSGRVRSMACWGASAKPISRC